LSILLRLSHLRNDAELLEQPEAVEFDPLFGDSPVDEASDAVFAGWR